MLLRLGLDVESMLTNFVKPNWVCCFEPHIRLKSSLTKVTGSHFSKDIIKHYILTVLLLQCSIYPEINCPKRGSRVVH